MSSRRSPKSDQGDSPGSSDPTVSDDANESSETLMTLEELSQRSGVVPRTIRYYQTKKLLQPPTKDPADARLARYGPEHAERLRLIGELHDRGLKLPAIRTLLDEGDATTSVADWLGLDASLRGAWDTDLARLYPHEELLGLLKDTAPGTLGLLENAQLISRQGGSWIVPNPALLELTIGLVVDGVGPDLVLEAGRILQVNLNKAANQLIDLFVKALGQGFGDDTDAATLVHALRPVAGDAARMIFGQQLELAIEELLADTKRLKKR